MILQRRGDVRYVSPSLHPRVDTETEARRVFHPRHFWHPQGCYAWVTTVRIAGRRPAMIVGDHIR